MATAIPRGRQPAARFLTVCAADSKVAEADRPETGYSSSCERSRAKPSRYASRAAGPCPALFIRSMNVATGRSSVEWISACMASSSRLRQAECRHLLAVANEHHVADQCRMVPRLAFDCLEAGELREFIASRRHEGQLAFLG